MFLEFNKNLVRQYLRVLETHDTGVLYDIIHPEYKPQLIGMPNTTLKIMTKLTNGKYSGIEELIKRLEIFFEFWQDATISALQFVAENNMVIAFFSIEFSHNGELLGIKPTGKRVSTSTYYHFTIKDNKIIGAHMLQDFFDIVRQIGLEVYEDEEILIKDYLETIKSNNKFYI